MVKQSNPTGLTFPDVPLDAVLSFLKDTRGALNWSAKDLRNCLRLDAKQAQQILAVLEMQGYIAKEREQWLTTTAGETISNSKKPQFSPDKVLEALDTLKERIEAVNRDKRSNFKISKAVAFGDFLSGRAQAQAAGVGVDLLRRDLGPGEGLEEKRRHFMTEFQRKSRLFTVQKYRPWMSQRSHRALL